MVFAVKLVFITEKRFSESFSPQKKVKFDFLEKIIQYKKIEHRFLKLAKTIIR